MRTYFVVDQRYDGCPQVHAHSEAPMEVLVEKKRLQESNAKEENGIDIPQAVGLSIVLSKYNHQPRIEEREREREREGGGKK